MPLSRLLQVVVLGEFSGGVGMQLPAAALPCLTDAYIHFYDVPILCCSAASGHTDAYINFYDVPILCCSAAAHASRMHIFIFMMFPFYVGRNIIYQHMSYVCRLCSHFLVTYDLHNIDTPLYLSLTQIMNVRYIRLRCIIL